MPHTAKATIDLAAIRYNFSLVKQCAPDARIMAVIKADAYGHGIVQVAKALAHADGFAVARLEEALLLRQADISQRILWLGGFLDGSKPALCAEHHIDVVIHSRHAADALLAAALPQAINVWLEHDSGMHRLGLSDSEFAAVDRLLDTSGNVGEKYYMTHFSGADEGDRGNTERQLAAFQRVVAASDAPLSLANSAALMQYADTCTDWVRPGIMLYGANPLSAEARQRQQRPLPLRPAMTLTAKVIAVRHINKGETVGYNSRWQATRDSVIATLGIGYGDGYPRHAGNGTPVLINGQRAALAGTVSMDLITVDITDCDAVAIGDEAVLWGKGLSVDEIADYADTISYQLLTAVSKRVPRFYID